MGVVAGLRNTGTLNSLCRWCGETVFNSNSRSYEQPGERGARSASTTFSSRVARAFWNRTRTLLCSPVGGPSRLCHRVPGFGFIHLRFNHEGSEKRRVILWLGLRDLCDLRAKDLGKKFAMAKNTIANTRVACARGISRRFRRSTADIEQFTLAISAAFLLLPADLWFGRQQIHARRHSTIHARQSLPRWSTAQPSLCS
jgi:hypothetical protein